MNGPVVSVPLHKPSVVGAEFVVGKTWSSQNSYVSFFPFFLWSNVHAFGVKGSVAAGHPKYLSRRRSVCTCTSNELLF